MIIYCARCCNVMILWLISHDEVVRQFRRWNPILLQANSFVRNNSPIRYLLGFRGKILQLHYLILWDTVLNYISIAICFRAIPALVVHRLFPVRLVQLPLLPEFLLLQFWIGRDLIKIFKNIDSTSW